VRTLPIRGTTSERSREKHFTLRHAQGERRSPADCSALGRPIGFTQKGAYAGAYQPVETVCGSTTAYGARSSRFVRPEDCARHSCVETSMAQTYTQHAIRTSGCDQDRGTTRETSGPLAAEWEGQIRGKAGKERKLSEVIAWLSATIRGACPGRGKNGNAETPCSKTLAWGGNTILVVELESDFAVSSPVAQERYDKGASTPKVPIPSRGTCTPELRSRTPRKQITCCTKCACV